MHEMLWNIIDSFFLKTQKVTSSPGIHIDEERGVLKLLSVRQDMKGEWTCLAESIAGYTRESVLMDVGCKLFFWLFTFRKKLWMGIVYHTRHKITELLSKLEKPYYNT